MAKLPTWVLEASVDVNPLSSPYWGTKDDGDAVASLGRGNGSGFFDFTGFPGFEQFVATQEDVSREDYNGKAIDPTQLMDTLKAKGYRLREANREGVAVRYIEDSQGNVVGEPQYTDTTDKNFGMAASLAATLATGGIAGAASLGPTATGALTGGVGGATNAGISGGNLGDIAKGGLKGAAVGGAMGYAKDAMFPGAAPGGDPMGDYMRTGAVDGSTFGGAGGQAGSVGAGSAAGALQSAAGSMAPAPDFAGDSVEVIGRRAQPTTYDTPGMPFDNAPTPPSNLPAPEAGGALAAAGGASPPATSTPDPSFRPSANFGEGLTGAQTSAYDAVTDVVGGGALAKAAADLAGGNLMDAGKTLIGGLGSGADWLKSAIGGGGAGGSGGMGSGWLRDLLGLTGAGIAQWNVERMAKDNRDWQDKKESDKRARQAPVRVGKGSLSVFRKG
jgi:hypothetical protein